MLCVLAWACKCHYITFLAMLWAVCFVWVTPSGKVYSLAQLAANFACTYKLLNCLNVTRTHEQRINCLILFHHPFYNSLKTATYKITKKATVYAKDNRKVRRWILKKELDKVQSLRFIYSFSPVLPLAWSISISHFTENTF